ncbi:unnamed protein product [Trichobilharzia regenti]|uniref:C2H2-type domain-containing protein n=1 Tax=Trichobilharzia regenti TaxID=157069 RepID=A0A183WNC3_TRIRE|nr:unnamed protein product [Trichobilharzia regenti]VDQ09506.1 unnamed protein product [Trichobilharzia regenti]
MADVTESRRCFRCRVLFNTDDEFWHHILNVDCDDSINATAAENSLPDSTHSNDESQSVCASVSSTHIGGVPDFENHQAKGDFEMNPNSPEQQFKIDLATEALEKSTNSPAFLFCDVCQVPFTSIKNKEEHENGKMHKKQIASKSNCSDQLNISQSLSVIDDAQEDLSKIHTHWPSETQNSVNTSSTVNETVDTQPQPTIRNSDEEEITRLLRRLCLTEILILLHNVGGDSHIPSRSDSSETKAACNISGRDLIETVRTICREELREILSEALQHASLQSRNVNT